ncbi:MAG: hypothetical protein R2856_37840 [Caldilineaceae bacterium]
MQRKPSARSTPFLADFDPRRYAPQAYRARAERFSREQFRGKLLDYLQLDVVGDA